ncbi:MAG: Asp/Glu racemase [Pseudomonadota bacterium]
MTAARARARLGVLVPFTNTNLEPDLAMMAPAGITLHAARLGGYDAEAIPDAAQMAGLGLSELDEPLSLIAGVRPDIVIYGCTSATLTHGPAFDQALAARIEKTTGAATVTAAGAVVAALRRLGATRIAFASPYVPAITAAAIAFLADCGVETVARAEVLATLDNEGQGAMTPDEVARLVLTADLATAQALVLSCTDMRAAEVAARLEGETGLPVVTSNTALLAEALARAGVPDPIRGFGRLLELPR